MDQRAIALNMVSMFFVLFLIVSVYCFFKHMRLRSRRWGKYISQRRYDMHRTRQKRVCNRMGLAVIGIVAICYGAVELGFLVH
jgi:hypothetical protein